MTIAIDPAQLRPLLVRASAGTGKTYRLAGRLLQVLLSGAKSDAVLATTFTRKAAGEILERLLGTLADAASDPAALDQLRQQVQCSELSAPECRDLLHRLWREIHRLRISTLDSFFSQLCRTFPFELQLPARWRLTDEIEDAWLQERGVDALIAQLEPQQLRTLHSMLSKGDARRSIAADLQSLVRDIYADARWCTAAAWQTLAVPAGPDDADITRAAGVLWQAKVGHASADKMMRRIADDLDARRWEELETCVPVIDAGQIRAGQPLTYYRKVMPPDVVESLQVAHAGVRTHVLSLLRLQSEATGEILQAYDRQILALRQQARAFGFDDIAFRLANWMRHEGAEILQQREEGAIDHLLLDEFQDTAPVQWQILLPLARRAAVDAPRRTFFCVGDTKQAIYAWRGGQAAIFEAVTRAIQGVEESTQNESYRSSPVIMEFVNRLFPELTRHPKYAQRPAELREREQFLSEAVHAFADQFPRHQAARRELPGWVRIVTATRVDGSADDRRRARLQEAAVQIEALAAAAPGRSIGVLTRTNASLARLVFLLRQRGVDASQEGGNPLTDSAAVELLLSAVLLTEHPGDLRWWFHLAHSPLKEPLGLEQIDQAPAAAQRLRERFEHVGLARALMELADHLAPVCSAGDCLRLRQLLRMAQQFEWNPQPRRYDFVRLVREKRVERPQQAQVRVMTVHKAKGLEFDAVVLPELDAPLIGASRGTYVTACDVPDDRSEPPGLAGPPTAMLRSLACKQWGLLPQRWHQAMGREVAGMMTEALCLMYVALTRPRYALLGIVDPASKSKVESQTPSALLYHALQCDADPTAERTVLFEMGRADWHQTLGAAAAAAEPPIVEPPRRVVLQPLPPVPHRNRPRESAEPAAVS